MWEPQGTGGGSVSKRSVVSATVDKPGVNIISKPRAGHEQRKRIIAHLGECHELGYLDAETYKARAKVASEAVTKQELAALSSDLEPLAYRPTLAAQHRTGTRRTGHALLAAVAVLDAGALSVLLAHTVAHTNAHGQVSAAGFTLMVTNIILGVAFVAASVVSWIAWEIKLSEDVNGYKDKHNYK